MPVAAVTGMATTFNLPNYRGLLLRIGNTDCPFTSAIGALDPRQGKIVLSTQWEWQFSDLPDPIQPQHLEGQPAPTATARPRFTASNVVQIEHKKVSISYTRLAAMEQFAGLNNGQPNGVQDEFDEQMSNALLEIKNEIEFSAINGIKTIPTNNSTGRRMGGILEAATAVGHSRDYGARTNLPAVTVTAADDKVASVAHGLNNGDCIEFLTLTGGTPLQIKRPYWVVNKTADNFELSDELNGQTIDITANSTAATARRLTPLSRTHVNNMAARIYDAGGLRNSERAVLMCGTSAKMAITAAYNGPGMYTNSSRTVGGVSVDTVLTDVGTLGVMLNPKMPHSTIAVTSLDQCRLAFLLHPQKGVFFAEALAKVGASEESQIYGEVGVEWGNPYAHGVIRGICYAG